MTMLLAAEDAGLGALFFGVFHGEAGAAPALGIPSDLQLLGAIALGWPLEDGAAPVGASARRAAPAGRRDHPPRRVVRAASGWRRVGSIRAVLGSVSPHLRGLSRTGSFLNAEAVVEAAQRAGAHQLASPASLMNAGTSVPRMTKASISTAMPRPMPNILMNADARRGEGEERHRRAAARRR